MPQTQQIHIRALEPGDADFMYEVENDPDALRYSDTVAPLSRKILRDYALTYEANPFAAGQLRLIVAENETKTPVGILDIYDVSMRHLHAFVGIYILPDHRRKGYAREAIKAAEDYVRHTLHLKQLGTKIEDSNTPSLQLFGTLGYLERGRLKDWICTPYGSFAGMVILTKPL